MMKWWKKEKLNLLICIPCTFPIKRKENWLGQPILAGWQGLYPWNPWCGWSHPTNQCLNGVNQRINWELYHVQILNNWTRSMHLKWTPTIWTKLILLGTFFFFVSFLYLFTCWYMFFFLVFVFCSMKMNHPPASIWFIYFDYIGIFYFFIIFNLKNFQAFYFSC